MYVGLCSWKCYIYDMLDIDQIVLFSLGMMLEDPDVIEVIHDCRQDSAALFYQHNIKLPMVFDTQVCLFHQTILTCQYNRS